MKVFFRNIHLYLSLLSGIVLVITCFTGAVLVFEKELQVAFNKERYFVEPQEARVPLDVLVSNVKSKAPKGEISGVKVFNDPTRSIEVNYVEKKEEKGKKPESAEVNKAEGKGSKDKAKRGPREGGNRKIAFVNPYTGQVLELYSYRETFFYKMFALHRWLLGSNDGIGKYIVGVSTFIFLFIIITGIVLWWPRTRVILMQRLKIKWDGSWKRLNHDFHIVLGFYSAIFLFIFAFTGLSWSFKWFNKGLFYITNSPMETSEEKPGSTLIAGKTTITLQDAYTSIKSKFPNAEFVNLSAPKDSAGVFTANILLPGRKEMQTDSYFIDQYSSQVVGSEKFEDRNLGQRSRASIKPIHTGSIFGLPSKVIAFIVCLFGTSFPITGTIMWIQRIRKKKTVRVKEVAVNA